MPLIGPISEPLILRFLVKPPVTPRAESTHKKISCNLAAGLCTVQRVYGCTVLKSLVTTPRLEN
jgi:hypothetical protein